MSTVIPQVHGPEEAYDYRDLAYQLYSKTDDVMRALHDAQRSLDMDDSELASCVSIDETALDDWWAGANRMFWGIIDYAMECGADIDFHTRFIRDASHDELHDGMTEHMNDMIDAIRYVREHRGLSVERVAEEMNYPVDAVRAIESHDSDITEELVNVASLLKTDITVSHVGAAH